MEKKANKNTFHEHKNVWHVNIFRGVDAFIVCLFDDDDTFETRLHLLMLKFEQKSGFVFLQ